MTELEKIEYAKSFIDKLANGINPLDDTVVKEDDIVNNVRLSRCFFYVSDILRQVLENKGINKSLKYKFNISAERLSHFSFSEVAIPISEIAKRVNELKDSDNMKNISHRDFTNWLLSVGMLYEQINAEGKTYKLPTAQGEEIGITTEIRNGQRGTYRVVLYNKSAQEFIIDNFEAILGLKYNK